MKKEMILLSKMLCLFLLIPLLSNGQDFRSRLISNTGVTGKYMANRASVINKTTDHIHNVIAECNSDGNLQITTQDQMGNILGVVTGNQFTYQGRGIEIVPVKMILATPHDSSYHCLSEIPEQSSDIIMLATAEISNYIYPCFIRLSNYNGDTYNIVGSPIIYEGHLAPQYQNYDVHSGAFASEIIALVPGLHDSDVKFAITGTDILFNTSTSYSMEKAQPFIILVDEYGNMLDTRAYEIPAYTVNSDQEVPSVSEKSASSSIVQIHGNCDPQTEEGFVIGGANIFGRSGFLIRTDPHLNIIEQRVDKANDSSFCPNGLWYNDLHFQPSNGEVYVVGASKGFGSLHSSIDINSGGFSMPSVDFLATPGFYTYSLTNTAISSAWHDFDVYDHSNDFNNSATGGLASKAFTIDRFTPLMTYQTGTYGEGSVASIPAIFQIDFSSPNDPNPVAYLSDYIIFPNDSSAWSYVASPNWDGLGILANGSAVDRIAVAPERQIGANLRSSVLNDELGNLALYNLWTQVYEQNFLWLENSTTILADNFWNSCKTRPHTFQNDQFLDSKIFGEFTELPGPNELGVPDVFPMEYDFHTTTCINEPYLFKTTNGNGSGDTQNDLDVMQQNNILAIESDYESQLVAFSIYDMAGRIVMEGKTDVQQSSIDISSLKRGIHMLVISTSGDATRHKFFK